MVAAWQHNVAGRYTPALICRIPSATIGVHSVAPHFTPAVGGAFGPRTPLAVGRHTDTMLHELFVESTANDPMR